MTAATADTRVEDAVAALDAWLDTMRGPGGYGGPVAHWWQQCLLYTGTGRDWRYEGIVAGYLTLWGHAGDPSWLAKARRAGDDLLAGQLPDGHFAASAFELNPAAAGTPHEAACDVALLLLATALRRAGHVWEPYAAAAQANLERFALGKLWDAGARSFRDGPGVPSFVPNKAATICEALFLLAGLRGEERWIETYALPTLDRIVAHQVRGGALDGAIAQNSFGRRVVAKYFPIYIARCVPALVQGYEHSGQERYLRAAVAALRFVLRRVDDTGAPPTVVYPGGRELRRPAWVAPLGDVLRAAEALRAHGLDPNTDAIEARLLAGLAPSGGIRTAAGFAAQAGGRPGPLPDFRDLLPVAGWCDKAFRYLAGRARGGLAAATLAPDEAECTFGGRRMRYRETPELIEVVAGKEARYRWRKGAERPEIAREEFWLR